MSDFAALVPSGITMSAAFRLAVEDIRLANERLNLDSPQDVAMEYGARLAVVFTVLMTYATAFIYIPWITASWIGMMWLGWATLLGGLGAGRLAMWVTSLRFYEQPGGRGLRVPWRSMSLGQARSIKNDSLTQVIELALTEIAQHTTDTFEILGKLDAASADAWLEERKAADERIQMLITVIEQALEAGGRLGSRAPLSEDMQLKLQGKIAEVGRRRERAKEEVQRLLTARDETDEADAVALEAAKASAAGQE